MLVLLDHPVAPDVRPLLSCRQVLHNPWLQGWHRQREVVLSRERPDVLLTHTVPDPLEAACWVEAMPDPPLVVLLDAPPDGRRVPAADPINADGYADRQYARARDFGVHVVSCPRTDPVETDVELYTRALVLAERRRAATRLSPVVRTRLATVLARSASIAMVGAGVVNLVTGLRLLRSGHRIAFYDSAPDPRSEAASSAYGCSRGGADARMFTLTEADGYFGTRENGPIPFLRPLKDNGWCLADMARLSDQEISWARSQTDVPPWLARSFTGDVLSFNVSAQRLWRNMINDEPELFENVNLRPLILRLYRDTATLQKHVRRQQALTGNQCQGLSPAEVVRRYPALSEAQQNKAFVGGLEVDGFTVQVHAFIRALVDLAERSGAVFHWERTVDGLLRAPSGLTNALRSGDEVIRADHYVLSPGAYGNALLRDTSSDGLVHGVVGTWVTLPNTDPTLENSLKISRPGHIAADANVTVVEGSDGKSWLVVGSGYGWTGQDPGNIDPAQLDALYAAVDDTAETFFPEAYARARRSGLSRKSRKYCVRPWTASSLPIFEIGGTTGGGLMIVTAGHNTGGFAQAPVIAEAVAAAVCGEDHPMHIGYHPERFRIFHGRDQEHRSDKERGSR